MKPRRVLVRVARHAVAGPGGELVAVGLGSCVAIVLYDAAARLGGIAHVLLPEPSVAKDRSNPFKFATTAVPLLATEMCDAGAAHERLEAYLTGGAAMFTSLMTPRSRNMGERNHAAARGALEQAGIPIRGEDVGGEWGRSVSLVVATGTLRVSCVTRDDLVLPLAPNLYEAT